MTHIPIDIDSINWDQYFGGSVQEGGQDAKYFVGQRYMRGYGVLGSIGRFLLPIAKNLASSVGAEGVEAGTKVLKDVSEGKTFTDALKEHGQQGIKNLAEKMKQCGKGEEEEAGLQKRQKGSGKATKRGKKRVRKITAVKKTPTVSMYPTRPASPTTSRELTSSIPKRSRRRKPDQLDIF